MKVARIQIGLIGCGWISEIAHMPSLAAAEAAEVVAVADMLDERRALATRWFPGATAYREATALLEDPAVEAVVVALPPAANASVAVAALEKGKHVYIEKPLAPSEADGAVILDAWRTSGRVGMIGYNFRRNPGVEAAVAAVRSGALGQLVSIQGHFTWAAQAVDGWRADAATGGGALSDLASHHIDLVALLSRAPVAQVAAHIRTCAHPDDTVDLMLETSDGTVASLHASAASGRNANALRLMGTDAHLNVDILDPHRHDVVSGAPPAGRLGRIRAAVGALRPAHLLASGREVSFERAITDFLAACRRNNREQLQPSLDAGFAVLRVIEAARRSAADGGRVVTIGPPNDAIGS